MLAMCWQRDFAEDIKVTHNLGRQRFMIDVDRRKSISVNYV